MTATPIAVAKLVLGATSISSFLRYAYLAARKIRAAKPRRAKLLVTFIDASIARRLAEASTHIGAVRSLSRKYRMPVCAAKKTRNKMIATKMFTY